MENMENGKGTRNLTIQDAYYVEILFSAVASCILGCILWKKALLPLYAKPIPNWILIAVLFFTITFVHVILTGLFECFLGRIYPKHEPLGLGKVFLFALLGALIVASLSGLLEFIYELNIHSKRIPTPKGGVVYVIDDSGSMYVTDPNDKRNQCVIKMNECLSDDSVCGLVRFSDKVDLSVDMAPLDSKHRSLMARCAMAEATMGETNIESGIYKAIEMCELSPAVKEASELPHLLLLTDGVSYCNENAVIKRCLNDGITIDAISLGAGTDIDFLKRLTASTGGTLTKAPSDLYLEGAFRILIGQEVKRCLLTPILLVSGKHTRLKVMQVLFLFLTGLAMETVVTVMLSYARYVRRHVKLSPIVILLGALFVMISDASLSATFFMIGSFLFPFFIGRKFQGFPKKVRGAEPKPESGFWAELFGKVEQGYYCSK